MTINRLVNEPDFGLGRILSSRSSRPDIGTITEYGEIFQGPKPLEEVVTEVVRQAVKFGYKLATKEAKEKCEKRFKNYLGTTLLLAKTIDGITELSPTIRIKKIRTNLDPVTQKIDLFVLIDYDQLEDRFEFSKVISAIERTMLIERNLIVEISYAQDDPKRIDNIAIEHDYPFVYQRDRDANR